jgi:large subunit ribosomal protein L3
MGSVRKTSQNVRVELVDAERNLLGISGSVPGARGNIVVIKEARKQ